MSLINDALKRAKSVQPQAPPPASGPQFRPAEPDQVVRRGLGVALPIGAVIVALLGLLLTWELSRTSSVGQKPLPGTPELAVRAVAPPSPPIASPPPADPPPAPPITAPEPVASPASKPVAVVQTPPPAVQTPAPPAQAPAALAQTPAETNALPVAEAPKPPSLKLQAIVYHPTRPSAMINGRTLFVGDRVGEWRVASISADSATLSNPTGRKVLNLAD